MTNADIVNGILQREGGYRNLPGDGGGPTNFGITAVTWGEYRKLGRAATEAEVQAIDVEQATIFYLKEIAASPFTADHGVSYEPLFVQLTDFAENSGQERAIRWLQRLLRIPVTGKMDDRTRISLVTTPQYLVHEALIAIRVKMIRGAVVEGKIAKRDESGLINRALSFSEIRS